MHLQDPSEAICVDDFFEERTVHRNARSFYSQWMMVLLVRRSVRPSVNSMVD